MTTRRRSMKFQPLSLIVLTLFVLLVPFEIAAQAPGAKGNPAAKASAAKSTPWTPPRLPDGRPDLSGFWSNNTVTPFERPAALAGKEFITDEEAKAQEKQATERTHASDRQAIE